MSSALSVLTKSLKIFDVTPSKYFQLNYLHSDQWLWERWCRWDGISVSTCLPCSLLRGPLKPDFLVIYLTTSLGVCNFRNTSDMRVIFFWSCSKVHVDLENAQENSEKVFFLFFAEKWISIGCVKLSLVRRQYLSSAVRVLTNSLRIFHVTMRHSFELNYLHSNQWIQ